MEADKLEAFTLMQMKVFFYDSLHLDFYEGEGLVVLLMRFHKFMWNSWFECRPSEELFSQYWANQWNDFLVEEFSF